MSTTGKRDQIWETLGLMERVAELIEKGFLNKGDDALLAEINRTILGGKDKRKLRKSELRRRLEEFIWDKDRLKLLRDFVKLDASFELLYKELSMIPKRIIDRKAKQLRGLSVRRKGQTGELGAGPGRLVTDAEMKKHSKPVALASHRLDRPYPIPVKISDNYRVTFINGAHLGLEYNRVIDENTLRNMFREAERSKDDAIFLTGALLWVDAKKSSGFLTTHRALYSGLDFDESVLPEAYREEARKVRKDRPTNKVSFAKLRERVLNAMGGWRKVTVKKDGASIFSGKIYFSFGIQEEEIIESAAHAHILQVTTEMRNDVMVERKLNEAILTSRLAKNNGTDTAETLELREMITQLLEKEKRMIQSNVDSEDRKRFVDSIRATIVSWFKEAIPNSEFLTQGSVVCKIGKPIVEIIQAPDDSPVSNSMDGYMKVAGQRSLENKLPDMALVAAPYNIDARWGVIERMKGAERDITHVWQLPVGIDRDYLREARPEMIRKASPIEKLVRNPGFEPGAFRLGYVNGIWVSEVIPISFFREHRARNTSSRDISEYIYCIVDSDNHSGQRSKEWVYDARTKMHLPLEVAFSELLTRSFTELGKSLPLHSFTNIGDNLQGHHFPTQMTIHPGVKSYSQVERLVKKILNGKKASVDPEELAIRIRQLGDEFLNQMRLRGEDWPVNQLDNFFDTSLKPRVKLFAEVLKSSRKVGLRIRGIGEALLGEGMEDTRDLGVVNWVGGDHFSHTVIEELTEGPLYRRTLIGLLLGEKSLGMDEEELSRLVKAPLWGEQPIGYGLISVPNGYEWGVTVRHKPAKSSGQNGDRMGAIVENLLERGDYGRIFTGRHWFQLSGHIHFYNAAFSRNKFAVSCASSTDGDAFGERFGFRRSNSGGVVVGIPAKGPEYGPIRIIPFPHAFLRAYFKEPWKIDWSSVFRDSFGF